MALDEHRRQRMYRKLEEVLGREEAGTLMAHLPGEGWADVARRSDIDLLRVEMRELDARMEARLESRLNSQTKTLVGLMSAQVVAVAGLAFAAARLA